MSTKQINDLKKVKSGFVYEVRTSKFTTNWKTQGFIFVTSKETAKTACQVYDLKAVENGVQPQTVDFSLGEHWLVEVSLKQKEGKWLVDVVKKIIKHEQKKIDLLETSLN